MATPRIVKEFEQSSFRKQVERKIVMTVKEEISAWESSGKPFINERPESMSFDAYKAIREMQNQSTAVKKQGVRVHTSVVLERDSLGRRKRLVRQHTFIKPKKDSQ